MKLITNTRTFLLRLFGAVIAAGGGVLLWYGGKQVTFDLFGGAMLSIPLEYLFLGIGLLLLLLPLVFVYLLALVLPERYEKRLLSYADNLDPEYNLLQQNPNPQTVSTILHQHIHRTNKRAYLFIFVAVVFVFVILPLLVRSTISNSQSKRESNRLVSLVQETRIDFASGDHIREHLHYAEGGIPTDSTSTRNIYEILRTLYDPSIKNTSAFDKAISSVYEARIKPNITDTGLLQIRAYETNQSTSETRLAPATYLTLLATICNMMGDNGKHVDPYIHGHQLMKLALTYVKKTDPVPATHNMAWGAPIL